MAVGLQNVFSAKSDAEPGAAAETGSASEGIVREFSDALARDQDVAVAVAVIKVRTQQQLQ